MEKTVSRRAKTAPKDGGLLVGDVIRNRGNHVLAQNGIELKGALAGAVNLLGDGYRAACHSVADLEACDVGADLDDGASHVASENHRVFEIGGKYTALILQSPVPIIDADGAVLDDNLTGARAWIWCITDFQRLCLLGGKPSRLIFESHSVEDGQSIFEKMHNEM